MRVWVFFLEMIIILVVMMSSEVKYWVGVWICWYVRFFLNIRVYEFKVLCMDVLGLEESVLGKFLSLVYFMKSNDFVMKLNNWDKEIS